MPQNYGAPQTYAGNIQPVNYGSYQNIGAWKEFRGGTEAWQAGGGLDCFNDIGICCYGFFCPCCMLCDSAQMLRQGTNGGMYPDAEMFECPGQCLSLLTTMGPYGIGYCIGMCVCPEHVACGCYTTSLIKMTMHKYNLTWPQPCGMDSWGCATAGGAPMCLCSAFWCQGCMCCLVHRELVRRNGQ